MYKFTSKGNIKEKVNESLENDALKDISSPKFKKIVDSLPDKDKKLMNKYVKDLTNMIKSKSDKSLEFLVLAPKILDIFKKNKIDIFNE